MVFDPILATQQYLQKHSAECEIINCVPDQSTLELLAESKSFLLSGIVALYCAHRFGWAARMALFWEAKTERGLQSTALFGFCLMAFVWLAQAPSQFYVRVIQGKTSGIVILGPDGQRIEDAPTLAGRALQWLEGYAWDGVGWALAAMLLVPLILFLISLLPRRYWLIPAFIGAACLIMQSNDKPYEYLYPMPDGPLYEDVTQIAAKAGLSMDRVHIGEQTVSQGTDHTAHAMWEDGAQQAVIGERFLNVLRAPFPDNPVKIEPVSAAEFRAVAAHEIAHVKHNHVLWGWAFTALMATGLAAAAAFAAKRMLSRAGLATASGGPAILPVIVLCFCVAYLLAQPINAAFSRSLERQADATSLELAGEPDGLAALSLRIARGRKMHWDEIADYWWVTHPDSASRIERAMLWKAENKLYVWQANGPANPESIQCNPSEFALVEPEMAETSDACAVKSNNPLDDSDNQDQM